MLQKNELINNYFFQEENSANGSEKMDIGGDVSIVKIVSETAS